MKKQEKITPIAMITSQVLVPWFNVKINFKLNHSDYKYRISTNCIALCSQIHLLKLTITAKMKTTLLLLAVIVCASALSTKDKEWEAFKTKFNKQYSAEEDARHFKIFTENKALIAKHNAGETTFKMGINKFADMTTSDTSFLRGYKSDGVTRKDAAIFKPSKKGDDYPDTQDWRNYGYVTGVKDQGQCGSCWSFSATGSLEGQHFAAGNPLVSLSEQNLVDCDDLSFGCNGGNMATAFHYVKTNGGIDSEESYPYEARNGICRYDPADSVATCAGYVALAQSEDDLLGASAEIGPISVAIDASHISFQLYTDGVYDEPNCSSTNLDHGVLVVGYGTYEGTPYWLVKNSWGTSWGIDGYIMMSRNKNNQCGIVTEASYPLV